MAGGHFVLVVDDEPLIRALTVGALEDEGFDVLEAQNGDLALTLLESRDDIRAVVTDVEMPGELNGFTLATLARQKHPEIAIIIVSGRVEPTPGTLGQDVQFLAKPFSPIRLASMVSALLTDDDLSPLRSHGIGS
jgi:CheY-like chemotaxis protein